MQKTAYIVDDDQAVRESLQLLLETHGFDVVAFISGDEFLTRNIRDVAGPIMLDVRMPGRDGLETLKELMQVNNNLSVIMMSGHADVAMAVRALKHGAADFIEKPFASSDILAAIERVMPTIETSLTQEQFQSDNLRKLAKLTKREREVMGLLVEGKPNKIVAADLGLSVRTVETHRAHLLSKLEVKSLSDLVRLSLLER
jgi:FixJ family two-component response regulator